MDAFTDNDRLIASSISEAAGICLQSLQDCVRLPALMHHEWAENRLAEFKLWAASVGAFAGDRASLDMRLATEWDTKSLVINMLVLLHGCIETCQMFGRRDDDAENGQEHANSQSSASSTSSVSPEHLAPSADPVPRSFSPWSDMSSTDSDSDHESPARLVESHLSQLEQAQSEVEQVVDHLARLGVAIRKSGSNARSQKADRLFKQEDHSDLFRYLTVVVLGRGSPEGREHYQVNPGLLSPVQERLIRANLRRRNRFLYAQRHAMKLAFATAVPTVEQFQMPGFVDGPLPVQEDEVAPEPSATVIPEPEETPELENTPVITSSRQPMPFTATSASAVGTAIQEVPRFMPAPSQLARTNITSTAAKVAYPRPPQVREGLRYFKCPCCCQTLSSLYQQSTHWKKHLMEDIAPYTCIIDDCPKPEVLYTRRLGWMQHVEKDHPHCWECVPCRTPGHAPLLFASVDDFLSHTRQLHGDSIAESQHETLVAASTRIVPLGISQCPLCDETGEGDADALFDHIAEHIHSFSLYSLPWPKDEEDGADDGRDDYFKSNDYFDQGLNAGSYNYSQFSESEKDSDGLASLPSNRDEESHETRQNPPSYEAGVGVHKSTDAATAWMPGYMTREDLDCNKEAMSGPEIGQYGIVTVNAGTEQDDPEIRAAWARWKPGKQWDIIYSIGSAFAHPNLWSERTGGPWSKSACPDQLGPSHIALGGPSATILPSRRYASQFGRPNWNNEFTLEVLSGPEICHGKMLRNGQLLPDNRVDDEEMIGRLASLVPSNMLGRDFTGTVRSGKQSRIRRFFSRFQD